MRSQFQVYVFLNEYLSGGGMVPWSASWQKHGTHLLQELLPQLLKLSWRCALQQPYTCNLLQC